MKTNCLNIQENCFIYMDRTGVEPVVPALRRLYHTIRPPAQPFFSLRKKRNPGERKETVWKIISARKTNCLKEIKLLCFSSFKASFFKYYLILLSSMENL